MQQEITYTAFMQPETIKENNSANVQQELTYTYGADYERIMGVLKNGTTTVNTRFYFAGGFEKETNSGGTRYIQYIASPVGLAAIIINNGGSDSDIHYTYTDHLGSILTVTNYNGTVMEAQQSFDAWGRRRAFDSWTLLAPTATVPGIQNWLYRGYTGHEHLDQFGLINMNGRMYDPVLGRMLSPDNYVADGSLSQDYNRYTYAKNNPLIYTDPDGNYAFFILPTIGWSKSGGLSIGLTFGVGFAGGLSAQVGIGYSFKSHDLSVYAGASIAFNTVYAAYSFSSGGSVGYTAGLSMFSGAPISTNFATAGASYNFASNTWGGNVSAWQVSGNGWNFDPSVSVSVFSEQTTNFVRGQGFKNNDRVLYDYVRHGNYQDALDYFGFEGTYNPDKPAGAEYVEGSSYYGATDPITGAISYGYNSFSSYHNLKATWIKESYIHRRALSGRIESQEPIGGNDGYKRYAPEERASALYGYKNMGRYLSSTLKFLNQAQAYQDQSYNIPQHQISFNWIQRVIFKIPRR